MKTFITQDNDYIIELSKRKSIFSSNRTICNITFKNNLGNIILSLNLSDIELVNIIDNIYAYAEFGGNIIYSIRNNNENNICYSIGISSEYFDDYSELGTICTKSNRDIFTVYSYRDDSMIKLLQFNISDSLQYFCDLLYETFIEDIDDITRKEILGL